MIAKGMSEVLVKFSEIVAKTGIPVGVVQGDFENRGCRISHGIFSRNLRRLRGGERREETATFGKDRDIYSGVSRYRSVYKRH